MSDQERFTLNLPGLLEVLAGSLYSTPKVGLRELIQNAHDSCIRRQVEGAEADYQPRIHITSNAHKRTVTITDNGHGLSSADIRTYLATIGRSYTRQLKENLGFLNPEQSVELIGEFGMGFLSAFLMADTVTLHTKSIEPDSDGLQWQSQGGEFYAVTPRDKTTAGTTVTLTLKPTISFVFDEDILIETIQQYADFLKVPIYVNHRPSPVNLMEPPWEAADPLEASKKYIIRAFGEHNPLCIIPLHDQLVDVGHDQIRIPLQGFLYVPPASVASVREYGDLKLFIRRMFILDQEKRLLPPWARFVQGVLDCPYLQPTASREGVHEDSTFTTVQKALEIQLGQALQAIATDDPETWRRIVDGHTDVITGWAVRDDTFFDKVADIVTFKTSRGYLTLPQYLKISPQTFYFLTRHLGALQEQLLAEGHDAPVIDAHWFAVKPFLQKYALWKQNINLVQMDGEVEQLLQPVPADPYQTLLDFYEQQGIYADITTFRPPDVPALMTYPEDVEFQIESKQALQDDDMPEFLADFVSDYLDQQETAPQQSIQGTLHLNANCPLIQQLAQDNGPTTQRNAVLMLIYQIARLFSGRAMTAATATDAFRQTVQAMTTLYHPGGNQ
ncbi:MAG TPA: ATP-binding protein [Anaerolineae bacterium]|nr:ATP-binding protein [Anaerolineae bacterium]